MASIINKKVKNYKYYYYVESKRVDGKPKFVIFGAMLYTKI